MLLELMAGRQLLRLAAAAMHVPPLHAAQLEAGAQLPAAAISAAAATMQQPLLAGGPLGHCVAACATTLRSPYVAAACIGECCPLAAAK